MKTSIKKLTNGLELYSVDMPQTNIVSAAIAFPAGSRHELAGEAGLAHFSEHSVFKGSKNYPTYRDVNCAAEDIGAYLNAYTSEYHVSYHITTRAEDLLKGLHLITDIVATPLLDPSELKKERSVIVQELCGSIDDPSDLAGTALRSAMYGRHPLGHSVLGTKRSIRSFTDESVRVWQKRRYGAESGIAVLAGATSKIDLETAAYLLEALSKGKVAPPTLAAPSFRRTADVRHDDTEQTNLCLAFEPQIDTSDSQQAMALNVYEMLLGGMSSSRLFEELREEKGLCSPFIEVAAGLKSSKCVEAYKRICEIVSELATTSPTKQEFERARSALLGKIAIAYEDADSIVTDVITDKFAYNQIPQPEQAIKLLKQVTVEEVVEIARNIDPCPAIGCVGPHQASDFAL
jgi:predicted Zn-dependent peptidase